MKTLNILLAILPVVRSHSWIDTIESECTGAIGYSRNYPGRYDDLMTWKFLGRENKELLPPHQNDSGVSEGFPRLSAPAGSVVRVYYTPNGHITNDEYAPTKSTYSISWNNADQDSQLSYRDEVADGDYAVPGAEAIPFDDGVCGEGRPSPDPCSGAFTIPLDANLGLTQFVWFWRFDKQIKPDDYVGDEPMFTEEEYSTGFDIDILAPVDNCESIVVTNEPSTTDEPGESTGVEGLSFAGECEAVSEGDSAIGISAIADSRCPNYVGCRADGCRFCKSGADNDQNSHLDTC